MGWTTSEEEDIDENPPEGLLVSDESDSNDPNIDTDEDSTGSTQDSEVNRDAEDAAGMIIDAKSVAPINEEEEMTTMQDLDEVVEMFPEEANDKKFRSAKNRPKRQNSGIGIDRLVVSFDGKTYKLGKQLFMR